MNKIILGSGSPRRYELLKHIWHGEIEVIKSNAEEIYPDTIHHEDIPLYLSNLKGNDLLEKLDIQENILLTADTIVICDYEVLEKPIDRDDAIRMLTKLSGNSHDVITGVCIYHRENKIEIVEKTKVYFGEISRETIEFYIDHYSPMDKAGSYGVQDFLGIARIKRIEGCYYNVMGLPTSRVWEALRSIV